MIDTWDYLAANEDYTRDTIPIDYIWERLRLRRDALLATSDWTQLPDAPTNAEDWSIYRQALRDLPTNTSDPRKAVWPEPPTV